MTTPTLAVGPRCRRCTKPEADCARLGGCCPECTHTFGEESPERESICADCDQPFTQPGIQGRPYTRCPACRQPSLTSAATVCTGSYAGTETGYYYHLRKDHTPPCDACRAAHKEAERGRTARRNGATPPTPETTMTTTPPVTPASTATPAGGSIEQLLARARELGGKNLDRAVQRVGDATEQLRAALVDYETKAAARAKVARLERELAAAKATLRGGVGQRQTTLRPATETSPCVKGCGRLLGPQGRWKHESTCTGTGT